MGGDLLELRPSPGRPVHRCKTGEGPKGGAGAAVSARQETLGGGEAGPWVLCRGCGAKITTRGEAIEVDGSHLHTFFNPAGLLFEIACYARAPGCLISGVPSAEFTWFKGARWQYASCGGCGAHLGWFFSGKGAGFHGLISSRLMEEGEKERREAP